MHTRPSAEILKRISSDEVTRNLYGLSFKQDRKAHPKYPSVQRRSQYMGGVMATAGAELYSYAFSIRGKNGSDLRS